MSLEPGYQQVVYSQSERIGLPNWSFFGITASGKCVVPFAEADLAWTYLQTIIDVFIMERAEQMAIDIGVYHGTPGGLQTMDEGTKAGIAPHGITAPMSELSFTQKETVGLPEKSSIEVFTSSSAASTIGQELAMLRYLSQSVGVKHFEKREAIKMNPRPWINKS